MYNTCITEMRTPSFDQGSPEMQTQSLMGTFFSRPNLERLSVIIIDALKSTLIWQNFQVDISGMCVEGVFSGEHAKQLNMVICEYLFRQGKLDVAEKIVKVCKKINECSCAL